MSLFTVLLVYWQQRLLFFDSVFHYFFCPCKKIMNLMYYRLPAVLLT